MVTWFSEYLLKKAENLKDVLACHFSVLQGALGKKRSGNEIVACMADFAVH